MFNALEPWHIIVLVVVLIALFGYKRLPAAARGLGQSMRIFRSEAKQMRSEGDDSDGGQGQQAPQQYTQPQFAAPQQIAPAQPVQAQPMQQPVQQAAPVTQQAPAPAPAPQPQQPAATPEQH